MTTVQDVLVDLGLERYEALFSEHEVDLAALLVLTEEDLADLGLPFGPRKQLLRALEGLRPRDATMEHRALDPPESASGRADGERRQLTVLFCDMVGFTELAGRVDPEILRGIIRTYEDTCAACITRYEGFVFQRLGDGIVAFFGYPIAHEGEGERAIRAGLDIVETFARGPLEHAGRLQVRIGVASGVVVVSSADGSAVGETMNLAARLQGIAEPGSIVISETVQRLAGGVFEYEDRGGHALKGIARETRAFRVTGRSAAASRFEAATQDGVAPLVGRQEELDSLVASWHEAKGGSGRVVLLSGEAGIGKSRMIDALREQLERLGVRTLRFQCSPFGVHSAFHPSIDALERALKYARDESAVAKLDKLESLVVGHYGLPSADIRFLAGILQIPVQPLVSAAPLSARRQKDEAIRVLVDMTEAAARARPTLVLFEDAHWADPSSLEVLDELVRRVVNVPLLVLITHRPQFVSRWPELTQVRDVNLARLRRADCRAIVARLARGKALPEQLVKDIVEKTDGVPLYLEEVTKAVLESGNLRELEDRYEHIGAPSDLVLPATLRDSLMARLDRVAAVKEIAQIGSVIGREFSYDLVAAVSGASRRDLDAGLERLSNAELAFRRGTIPDATWTFKHALVQDVAYDSLLKSRRAELHGAIARALIALRPQTVEREPESVARHFVGAGLDAESIPYWQQAGERSLRRTALPEAIAHLTEGLAALGRLPQSVERDRLELRLRTRLGPAMLSHKGWASADVGAALLPAWRLVEALEEPASVMPVAFGLWVHNMSAARLRESARWAERMLSAAERTGDDGLRLSGLRAALTSRFWLGDLVGARAMGDELRALYDPAKHGEIARLTMSDPLTGDGIYRAHYLWMLGYPDQALSVAHETARYVRELNNPFEIAFALTLGAQVYEYTHRPADLLSSAEGAARVGQAFGVPLMSEIMAEIGRAQAWLLGGRTEDGIAHLRASSQRLNDTGHRVWVAYLGARIGEAVARAGDRERGLELVQASLSRVECEEDRVHRAEMLRIKGNILRALGRTADAERTLRASIDVAQSQHAKSWELRATIDLAQVFADRGDRALARGVLSPIYAWFTEGHGTHDLQQAKAMLESFAG